MLWRALPAIEQLQTAWDEKAKDKTFHIYHSAIQDGIAKLKKYYSHCKDCFAADMGHIHHRDSVVSSQSQVLGLEKGGEGRGQLSAMKRERGRQDRHRTELNK